MRILGKRKRKRKRANRSMILSVYRVGISSGKNASCIGLYQKTLVLIVEETMGLQERSWKMEYDLLAD